MKHAGINLEQVKINNRSSILKLINDCGPISRKDIALATGLTPAAVTLICTSLIEEGILTETGIDNTSKNSGRKKVFVNINYDVFHVLVVAIELELTTIAVCNMKGEVIAKKVLATDKTSSPEDFLKVIVTEAKKVLKFKECKNLIIQDVSVTLPGIVDSDSGKSIHSYGIWKEEVDIKKLLADKLNLGLILENNVNAFTTAELLFGEGKDSDNFILIKWGPGVGSSIVINNKIYEGKSGKTAELGHVIVDPDGDKCSCGKNGCLETKISFASLNKIKKFNADDFWNTVKTATKEESKKFEEAFSTFSRTIVNELTLLSPNKVVLCGKLFAAAEIRNTIIAGCKKLNPELNSEEIVYTSLNDKEDIIGPVAMFLEEKLFLIK